MAAKSFARLVGGKWKQIIATVISGGAANAGDIPALDDSGRLHMSLMPAGIGANTQSVVASEAIGAGKFVNYWPDASGGAAVIKMRLADNSNGRAADGFVLEAVSKDAAGTVYPLDSVNSALTGLSAGTEYYLGTAGGLLAVPLDETLAANQGVGKVSQFLGVAKSATELVTNDRDPVTL